MWDIFLFVQTRWGHVREPLKRRSQVVGSHRPERMTRRTNWLGYGQRRQSLTISDLKVEMLLSVDLLQSLVKFVSADPWEETSRRGDEGCNHKNDNHITSMMTPEQLNKLNNTYQYSVDIRGHTLICARSRESHELTLNNIYFRDKLQRSSPPPVASSVMPDVSWYVYQWVSGWF